MTGQYDDIINLPRHESATRPLMSRENRAAQFSPFAALTGYTSAIKEAGRLTDTRIELGESDTEELEAKLRVLTSIMAENPEVSVTYFQPDGKKDGGAYATITGVLDSIDDVQRVLTFSDNKSIAIPDILEIECDRFMEFL